MLGKLDFDFLKLRGIFLGFFYGKIKNGEIVIVFDGSLVIFVDVLGLLRFGRKVVIFGDTCDFLRIMDVVFDVDVVVYEVIFENEFMEICIDYGYFILGIVTYMYYFGIILFKILFNNKLIYL